MELRLLTYLSPGLPLALFGMSLLSAWPAFLSGAFEPGRHTIVFHLLTPSRATRSVSFTVCERYS